MIIIGPLSAVFNRSLPVPLPLPSYCSLLRRGPSAMSATLQSAPPVQLNQERFLDLLTRLIGESETLQNSPLQGERFHAYLRGICVNNIV